MVSVGQEVDEMQAAGWIGAAHIPGVVLPTWTARWLSVFPDWETIGAQLGAVALVLGSYLGVQRLRLGCRRRRRGRATAVTEGDGIPQSAPASAA